jgi:hypothetical protein
MVQRYISAEQSIAAAGAAFACMDEDYSDIAGARMAARNAQQFWSFKDFFASFARGVSRFLKLLGFKEI